MAQAVASYGTDESGLVWGFRFGGGEEGFSEPVDSETAARWLDPEEEALRQPGEFCWLHFDLANASTVRWLQRHGGISPAFFDSLSDELRSTRIERNEDALIAVLNDVLYDFSFDSAETSTLWVSLDQRLVVTARQSPLRSIDQLRTAVRSGRAIRSTSELLEKLLRAQAEVLVAIVRDATRRVDRVEDELLAGRLNAKRARLGTLRRLLVRLQRLLAPEPASLYRLLQHPPAWMHAQDVQDIRDASEEFSVAIGDMSSLHERIDQRNRAGGRS